MVWYVYIIESQVDGTLYKGYSSNYQRRLEEHNAGLSTYTSHKCPWILKYVEIVPSKTEAIKRESMLKRQNRKYLEWLFSRPSNILLS